MMRSAPCTFVQNATFVSLTTSDTCPIKDTLF